MSEFSDRLIMTLIAGTAVAGFLGWILTGYIWEWLGEYVGVELPIVLAVLFAVVLIGVWEGLDHMD